MVPFLLYNHSHAKKLAQGLLHVLSFFMDRSPQCILVGKIAKQITAKNTMSVACTSLQLTIISLCMPLHLLRHRRPHQHPASLPPRLPTLATAILARKHSLLAYAANPTEAHPLVHAVGHQPSSPLQDF